MCGICQNLQKKTVGPTDEEGHDAVFMLSLFVMVLNEKLFQMLSLVLTNTAHGALFLHYSTKDVEQYYY